MACYRISEASQICSAKRSGQIDAEKTKLMISLADFTQSVALDFLPFLWYVVHSAISRVQKVQACLKFLLSFWSKQIIILLYNVKL